MWFTRVVMRVRLPHLPLAPVVKRKSRLASNETFRVRLLVGALSMVFVVYVAGMRLCESRGGGFNSPRTPFGTGVRSQEIRNPEMRN
jgi:hypothetical protein